MKKTRTHTTIFTLSKDGRPVATISVTDMPETSGRLGDARAEAGKHGYVLSDGAPHVTVAGPAELYALVLLLAK